MRTSCSLTTILRMLVSVAMAPSEAEAEIICGRLNTEGIAAVHRGGDIPQRGETGAHGVLVEEADAARAREILAAPPFSDEELAELSEQAAAEPPAP
jgi:hypothetical protein